MKLIIVRAISDVPLPPEVLLTSTQELIENNYESSSREQDALLTFGDIFLFNSDNISEQKKLRIITEQTGITKDDFLSLFEASIFCLGLRLDRLPLRYLSIDENKYEWISFVDIPDHLDSKQLIKEALLTIKKQDDLAKRTISAASLIHKFTDNFGHKQNPLRTPKLADKRVVKWIYDEIKSGNLSSKAIEDFIPHLNVPIDMLEDADRLYYLFRLAWRITNLNPPLDVLN
jgi:hypothetical protein